MKHKRQEGELEFRVLMIVTWPAFFLAALVKRLLPWKWGKNKRSVFEEARVSAYNTIPFAFY